MKRAILVMNMGGPSHLGEVELFLNNIFNDRCIIAAPKPIRMLMAKLMSLGLRPIVPPKRRMIIRRSLPVSKTYTKGYDDA